MNSLDIKTNEVVLKDNSEWLYFSSPHQVVIAERLEQVIPALHEIEGLIKTNGWYAAGFLSYEAASAFDHAMQTCSSHATVQTGASLRGERATEFPYLWFGLYPKPYPVTLPKPKGPKECLDWHPTIDRETYNEAIERIKDHIAQGRTYQVNYTVRLRANYPRSAWEFFLHLAHNQNKHAAYVNTDRYVICSASPELFFELNGNKITCQPMKGTTQRGRTNNEDHERSVWLHHSEKNRAENVMIVDMIRNDLGRIAEIGSIAVPKLFETERYPTLWQMTSTVTARTTSSVTEIFRALFPCASVTGAPKVSTMKIIAELENTRRNLYTGSIGYISPYRKAKFNVAIRTVWIDRKSQIAEYGVGGGIVWDSTNTDEYAEALLKARVLTQQPLSFSLLETMLWTPEEGFFLSEKHIARMMDSADYFALPITKGKLEGYLAQIASSFYAPQRVRILLDQAGELRSEFRSFEDEKSQPLRVCLAQQPIDSNDIFLFHKTTQRTIYESAREGCEEFDDVLLYNGSGEFTEFTIGNLVVEIEGVLITPPISCGVLPGTFRAYLVETGQVVERTIHVEQIGDCTKIFRVNSIRKWQQIQLEQNPQSYGPSETSRFRL